MTTTLLAPRPLPPPIPPDPPPRVRQMRYEPGPGSAATIHTASRPPAVPVAPDPPTADAVRRTLAATVRLALEVLDGRRPPAQLRHHFDAAALRYWRAAAHQRRVRAPARVVRLLIDHPRAGAAEVTAVCQIDGRVRALAARFDRCAPGGPWQCTAVRLG